MRNIVKYWRNRRSDGVLRDSSRYLLFSAGVTIINIVLRKYLSVKHSVVEYGSFIPLMAILMLALRAFGVFPLVATKRMSAMYIEDGSLDRPMAYFTALRRVMIISLIVFSIIMLGLSPLLQALGAFVTLTPVLSVLMIFIISIFFAYYQVPLQVMQWFTRIAALQFVNVLLRFIVTLLVFQLFSGGYMAPYTKSFGAQLLSAAIFFTILCFHNRRAVIYNRIESCEKIDFIAEILPVFLILFFHAFSGYIDEIIARAVLAPRDAGLYGAIVTISKSSVFLIAPLVFILFPKMSSAVVSGGSRRLMLKGLILIFGLQAAGVLAVLLFSEQIIAILTDVKYHHASGYLKFFFIAFIPHGFLYLFLNFFIIHFNKVYLILYLLVLVLHAISFFLVPPGIRNIIIVTGISGVAYFLLSIIFWIRIAGQPEHEKGNSRN